MVSIKTINCIWLLIIDNFPCHTTFTIDSSPSQGTSTYVRPVCIQARRAILAGICSTFVDIYKERIFILHFISINSNKEEKSGISFNIVKSNYHLCS